MKRVMLVLLVVGTLLAGCDYTVPLVKTPDIKIDNAITGLWQKTGDTGKIENLLVLPMSEQEYLVTFPAGSENAMFARACLWRGAGLTLVQLNWFGTAQGKVPDDNKTFQLVSCAIEGDTMKVRLLNPDVFPKRVALSDDLAKTIAAKKDDPKLFRAEMVFQKVTRD